METTSTEERESLAGLLRAWSGQPFAERGGLWRTGRAPLPALSASRSSGHLVTTAAERGGTARFVQRAADPSPEPEIAAEPATSDGETSAVLGSCCIDYTCPSPDFSTTGCKTGSGPRIREAYDACNAACSVQCASSGLYCE